MSKIEIWKDIPNYEGYYQVSSLGRVKSLKRTLNNNRNWKERILSPTKARGYLHVIFSVSGNKKTMKVHRLVMLAFVGDSNLQVNHKNGLKTDNRLENLEYCTNQENINHAVSKGLILNGVNVNTNKLTELQAIRIKYSHNSQTQKEIAEMYGVSQTLVSQIRIGKAWKHI